MPLQDQWDKPFVALSEAFSGQFSFNTYFEQHNEARKVLPTLMSVGLALVVGEWRPQLELYFGFALSLGLVGFIYLLSKDTPWLSSGHRVFLLLLFTYLLWSPMSWYFHIWGITFERLIPELALVIGVWLSLTSTGVLRKILLLSLLAVIGQFSFVGGVVIWPFFSLIVIREVIQRKASITYILLFFILFSIFFLIYFYNYHHPVGHSSFAEIFSIPLDRILIFFLSVLGRAFTDHPTPALVMGSINLALFVFGLLRFLYKDWLDATSWTWAIVGGYALGQATLATLGRLPMSEAHALRADYVLYGVYVLTAGFALSMAPSKSAAQPIIRLLGYSIACALLITTYIKGFSAPSAFTRLEQNYREVTVARNCLHLAFVMPAFEKCAAKINYPDSELVVHRARVAQQLGFLRFATVGAPPQGALSGPGGSVDIYKPAENGVHVAGWAMHGSQRADVAVFTLVVDSVERLVGVIPTGVPRPDVARLKGQEHNFSGWEGFIPRDKAPSSASLNHDICNLQAYAFSAKSGYLVPLNWPRAECLRDG